MRIIHQPIAQKTVVRCAHCGKESLLISKALGLCLDCIRLHFHAVLPQIEKAHSRARAAFNLPSQPPRDPAGKACRLCVNECRIPQGQRSYCGLRLNEDGRLIGATSHKGNVSWYHDPLPTNCVANWVCPGGTGVGYPDFAYRNGPEYGYQNLAVFYQACSFDCLFCQNWHYRRLAQSETRVSPSELADQVDKSTACVCYFGGDPSPQLPHSLRVARSALEKRRETILRICWETNGSMHPALLRQMARLSLESGGCIKFDLKAWSQKLHLALCGITNRRTLENFQILADYARLRPDPPLLVASTLLVPGYVDSEEVSQIAAFIASLDPDIPYSLLGFAPQFYMTDLPTTSRRHAREALEVAKAQGLNRVRIGNLHLLDDDY